VGEWSDNVSDLVVSWIRTFVPVVVGVVVGWLVSIHLPIVPGLRDGLASLLSGGAIMVWYTAVRWLEAHWSWLGWLLGVPKQPTYKPPAA
jgi:hypothetical protein